VKLPRLAVLAVALGLMASACTQAVSGTPSQTTSSGSPATSPTPTSPTATPSGQPASAFHLTDCTSTIKNQLKAPDALQGKLQVGCGTLSVPLDYGRPHGPQIDLAVAKIHDTDDTSPIGTLFLNPGGPGEPGYSFALSYLAQLPVAISSRFDIVAFDPRGTGKSTPINCLTDAQREQAWSADVDASTPSGLARAKALAAQMGQRCKARLGSSLQYFNTVNAARDINQIRLALHQKKINYLGFSYGTELGWTYLHMFPKTARAFVLDGAVDPDTSGTAQSANQIGGFEVAFGQFRAWCQKLSACQQIGDPRQLLQQAVSAAQQQPLQTTLNGRTVNSGTVYLATQAALYQRQAWQALAVGLYQAAVQGNATVFARIADLYEGRNANGHFNNSLDALNTYSCNDSPVQHTSDSELLKTAQQWVQKYPDFGRPSSGEVVGCYGWPAPRTPVPDPKAATPSKVLVVGNTHDPATPYRGAQDLARDLGNAELLSWDGQGHTSYREGSTCVDSAVNQYLLALKLPPPNTLCPAK
jgi:pimeloyl-ACP methyl ester carboxylesterase